MWIVRDIELRPARMDFTSSEQGFREVVQVIADGTTIVNAVDLVEWSEPTTQVIVCECCGFAHCQPGGWVALRRVGDLVALVPAFAEMQAGAWERSEYTPPSFMWTRGAPLFSLEAFAQLQTVAAAIPARSTLPPLTGLELVRCVQWTAPMRVLGTFPDAPTLRHEVILAASDGDLADAANALVELIDQVILVPEVTLAEDSLGTPMTFHLDGWDFQEWSPAVRAAGDGLRMAPAPGLVASIGG